MFKIKYLILKMLKHFMLTFLIIFRSEFVFKMKIFIWKSLHLQLNK